MLTRLRATRDAGFTLVEVIIAVAIVGVLAGIAIPVTVAQLSQGNRGTANQDGAAWAVSIGNALANYTNLGNAAPNTTSAITLTGTNITIAMSSPSPTTLPSTVTVPVAVTSGSTIYRSGIGTTHWCIQVKNSTESFVFNETGQVPSATTCLADGTTDGNAQAQTGKAVPGVPGLVTAALPAAADATAAGGLNPYNTATISWVAPTPGDAAISKYVVTTYPGGAQCQTTGALTCTIPNLVSGNAYAFNVVASNVYGSGLPSDLSANITVGTAPTIPSGVSGALVKSGTTFTLTPSWSASSPNGAKVTSYTIQYSLDSTLSTGVTTVTTSNGTGLSFPITGLSIGTYYFRVKATNVIGSSDYSSISNATATPPAQVTGLALTPGTATGVATTSMALAWTAPAPGSAGTIDDYLIEYKMSSSGTWSTWAHTPSAATSATLTGLQQGTNYDVRVSAISVNGTGTSSSVVTKSTVIAQAATVTGVTNNAWSTVSWNAITCPAGTSAQYQMVQSLQDGSAVSTVRQAFPGTALSANVGGTGGYNQSAYVNARCVSATATGPTSANSSTTTWTMSVPAPVGVDTNLGPSVPAQYMYWWGSCPTGTIQWQWWLSGSGFGSRGSGGTWVTYTIWYKDFGAWGSGSYGITARCVSNGVSSGYTTGGGAF